MKFKAATNQRGFTLIEALVVIGLIAILASIGVPSFLNSIKKSEITNLSNNWLRMSKMARSEAVTRKVNISICPASAAGTPSCSTSGSDWKNGWVLFTDLNADRSISTGDEVLAVGEAFNHTKQPYLLATNSGTALTNITALGFAPTGRLTIVGPVMAELIVRICDSDKKVEGLDLRINAVGVSSQKALAQGSNCNATPIL